MILVFVIGRPGSGKTIFTGLLKDRVREISNKDLAIFNDREILLSFARERLYPDLIRLTNHDNFTVLDQKIFDLATRAIIEKAVASSPAESPFAVVEFSRQNYVATFAIVESVTDQYELIIYLTAPLEVCIERNMQRTSHVVPESEMRNYFQKDDIEMLRQKKPERVLVLTNDSTIERLEEHASLVMRRLLGEADQD